MALDVLSIRRRYEALRGERSGWDTAWASLSELFLPCRWRSDSDDTAHKRPKLNDRLVNSAGVLAMRPRVLILDEPTAGLDPAGRNSILQMIRDLHAAGGLTVIMVSHSMDDISTLATRLVVMSRGELVMTGTPREVFTQQEKLRSIGLGVPQAAELTHALIAEGFDLPGDLYTLDEVCHAILALKKEGRAC